MIARSGRGTGCGAVGRPEALIMVGVIVGWGRGTGAGAVVRPETVISGGGRAGREHGRDGPPGTGRPPHPRSAEHITASGGRPWTDDRAALEGILFVLRTGCELVRARCP
jgi:hypothetical protein